MFCRIMVAIFISPPLAIGTAVVMELFFQHERGQKMGIWAWVFIRYFLRLFTDVPLDK
jgi:hypothetical protein